jgi:chorismate mutase/prephenate dehydratase
MQDKKRDIAELRQKIREIDREIVQHLDARARVSKRLRSLLEGEPLASDGGEREWLAQLVSASSGELPAEALVAILRQIRAEARALEQPARIAYLGPEGGHCHLVAKSWFGSTGIFAECATVVETLDEVVRERAACAVFPFESTIDGLAQPAVQALAQTELVLVGAQTQPARYSLMCRTGNVSDVDKVYATPAAHAACERYLARVLPRATVLDVRSPLVAAQLAGEDHGGAALVPEECGRSVDLRGAEANVGDEPDLAFRYGLAASRPASRTGSDTTALLFSIDDSPGALFEVLKHFSERGINLSKLQSRPVRGESWDYVFYVEVGGHVTDRPVVTALEAIKRATKYLKVLGSFPSA